MLFALRFSLAARCACPTSDAPARRERRRWPQSSSSTVKSGPETSVPGPISGDLGCHWWAGERARERDGAAD